jgi:glycosyltransferase involved in cell wall biosynthesis
MGGTPTRIKNLLSCLIRNKNIELSVFSWDDNPSLPGNFFKLSNKHFDDLKKIYNFVKTQKTDIIISHTTSAAYYLFLLKPFIKAKLVLEVHGFIDEEALLYGQIGKMKYFFLKFIFSLFYRIFDLIFVCSEGQKGRLLKYTKNIVNIPGGVDMNLFNPQIKPMENKNNKNIIIGYAGNFRIWQGIEFLLEAFKELKKSYPEFFLYLLLTEKNDAVKTIIDGVKVFGAVEYQRVGEFLASCDILCIPRPDNAVVKLSFPNKILEYMAMGKAVIYSNAGDVEKIVKDGYNGLLYEPGDKRELIKCFEKLRNQELKNNLGQNAFLAIKNNYTWEIQGQRFYKSLVNLI